MSSSKLISRSDMRMFLRALQQGWPIDREKMVQVSEDTIQVIENPDSTDREKLLASKILLLLQSKIK